MSLDMTELVNMPQPLEWTKPTAWMPIDAASLSTLRRLYTLDPHPDVVLESCLCDGKWAVRFAPRSTFGTNA